MTPYSDRRARLIDRMGSGVAVIATAPERTRNRDTHYGYRHDSYFYYLTGFSEPEAVLVLIAGDVPRSILFCREKNEEREIWDGWRCGPGAARERYGFDEAFTSAELDAKLPELIADQPSLHYVIGEDAAWDARMMTALNAVRAQSRAGRFAPSRLFDIRQPLDDMRLIKDLHEQSLMRRAADISTRAHRRAMQATRAGAMEYEIEAELLHEFRRSGSEAPAYGSIVAGGANACVLHYVSNDAELRDGDLLLIDAGCELGGYASDITRTWPVNGRFSGAQRDVYQLVLDSQDAAFEKVRAGARFIDYHDAAVRVLAQGFVDLKLLEGSVDSVIEQGSYRRFYMHRTGHWLGMDVHDAGEYRPAPGGAGAGEQDWRRLEAGMVLTVEPGCYIRPSDDVPEAFWNIGIRIEDDVIVEADGCDIYTTAAPKTIADIEAVMQDARG
ncbi:MAG: aminopeptidase P N-terminal domain-containing protein [Gammaproteobacteria bacterium]|nr:aminopeptidase P N-terminal domain-containing protein [Gammaproteobacteria bacterium]MBU0770895.1 aminopeptidase P N-terminal domain-containing protein [Gammaproteobacteria bacterium]MBU0856823.1 aminopeptidase P N-terminal domain-containing protein [Gammaproteobacteria bacterium]MBU1845495.1 aminopeptidase P N-terminal domain-containing protein [Gammaproteobacteria bacterium]